MPLSTYFENNKFTEAYETVKTLKIVMNERMYKLEINARINPDETIDYYDANCYVETEIRVDNATDRAREGVSVWAKVIDFPWIHRDTINSAEAAALGFLSDRFQN